MFAPRLRLITLLCATLIAGCGTPMVNPVTGETERTVMDEAAEVKAGQEAHQQVLQEYGRYDNAALQNSLRSAAVQQGLAIRFEGDGSARITAAGM